MRTTQMQLKPKILWFLVSTLALLGVSGILPGLGATVEAKTVSLPLPLAIDYPLLRSLVANTAFTDAGETAVVLKESSGCRRIVLSRPTYSGDRSLIRFEVKVAVLLGNALGDTCLAPVQWEGYLVFSQRPRIDPAGWTLSFDTVDAQILDRERQPAKLVGVVWDLIKTRVYAYLNAVRIDLAPPVGELKAFLGELFAAEDQPRAERMASNLQPGGVLADTVAVRIALLTDVDETSERLAASEPEDLSGAELTSFTANWETWDAYLAQMLGALAGQGLSADDRHVLLDTLLAARHAFVHGLANQSLKRDFVRAQFVLAWRQLAPVFRRQLSTGPSGSLLGYLAFFTASDALVALDQIGPELGIEISRAGLIRLARLLGQAPKGALAYSFEVDRDLRKVLGLGPPVAVSGPVFDGEELELESLESQPESRRAPAFLESITALVCPTAWAAKPKPDSLAEIRTWMVPTTLANRLIERMKAMLGSAAQETLKKRKTSKHYQEFFPRLAVATAWQESCFRQYIVKKNKVVYLRSYNGSSVGLMQINERVWRGVYDLNQLRWNIRYNALAGCEVLDLYVSKYIEGNPKNRSIAGKLKDDTLASLVYAMYNSGPQDLSRFLSRSRTGKYHLSDKLFKEKYAWVKTDRWQNIRSCLGTR